MIIRHKTRSTGPRTDRGERARGCVSALAASIRAVVASLLLDGRFEGYSRCAPSWSQRSARPVRQIAPPPGVPQLDANQPGELRELRARENGAA